MARAPLTLIRALPLSMLKDIRAKVARNRIETVIQKPSWRNCRFSSKGRSLKNIALAS